MLFCNILIKPSSNYHNCHNHNKQCCKDIATVSEVTNHKKKILFVDDEPDLTSLFKMALESKGLYVDVFNDSADVLKNFKSDFYDLIILDIVMPNMDGFDLYIELRKVDPDLKVCFLTASEKYREDLRGGEYHRLSKDLFIKKPLSMKELIKEIHKRVGSK